MADLCAVKVKLTIALADGGNLLVSRAFRGCDTGGRFNVARGGVGIFFPALAQQAEPYRGRAFSGPSLFKLSRAPFLERRIERQEQPGVELIDLTFTVMFGDHTPLNGTAMGLFRRKASNHLVRVHPDNVRSKDWLILLEAGTIIGPSPERLRVARSTLDRKIVKKYNILLRAEHFLDVEGYDPRIHAIFFCPQLYKYDSDKKLVPLQGDEIGRLIARALEGGIAERRPWYEPSEKLPDRPIIDAPMKMEFDALVVDMPVARNHAVKGSKDGGDGGANPKR